jgi:hypothetical protein
MFDFAVMQRSSCRQFVVVPRAGDTPDHGIGDMIERFRRTCNAAAGGARLL